MRNVTLVLGLIVLIASAPALAASGDKIVRFGTAYSSPTGDLKETESDPPYYYELEVEADAALGLFTGFEFMINDLVGFDATLMHTNHDIDFHVLEMYDGEVEFEESMKLGDVTAMPLFLSVHFHFLKEKPVDLYAGPTVGYVMYGDLKFVPEAEEQDLSLDNDFGIGVVAGIDVPFGSGNWNFSSAVRYIKTEAEFSDSEGGEALDIDPWILQVGVGVKF